jgi:CDP-diglyceride synthetase
LTSGASSADGTTAAARPSKAARVWKRTWVGGSLAGALAVLVVLAYGEAGEVVVLGAGCALALVGALELGRMGRFASLGVASPLLVAAAGQIAAAWSARGAGAVDAARVALDLARPLALAPAAWGLVALAPRRRRALVTALATLFAVVTTGGDGALLPPAAFWGVVGLGVAFALGKALDERERRVELALVAGLAVWVAFPLPALATIWRAYGADGLLALVLLSKVGDIFGYYVGNAIGRSHPFPSISPGKTTAGCVASLVAGVAFGGASVALGLLPAAPLGIAGGLVAGALVNLGSQAGDLLESRAKRWAGVKDSGRWFGPSGGVLDLVDSLLVSVPVALVTWPLLFDLS